jgi:hypothetical protein
MKAARFRNLHICIVLLMLLFSNTLNSSAGNISPTDKFIWSDTGGWINFGAANGDLSVYNDHLEGFIWAENTGWIEAGAHFGGGTFSYGNTTSTNWGVNRSGSALSGYAWSDTVGWINFSPTGGGVSLDSLTGLFSGWAWGENIGWIHFQNSTPTYNLAFIPSVLTIALTGSGNGNVNGDFSCSGVSGTVCQQIFNYKSSISLTAYPSIPSVFDAWTGCSSPANPCSFTLFGPTRVTANFLKMQPVERTSTGNAKIASDTIQAAFDSALDQDIIRTQEITFTENLTLNRPCGAIFLEGGYDGVFADSPRDVTRIKGFLKVKQGSLRVNKITVY